MRIFPYTLVLLALLAVPCGAQPVWERLPGPCGGTISNLVIDRQGRLFSTTSWEIYRSAAARWDRVGARLPAFEKSTLAVTPSGDLLALLDSSTFSSLFRSTDGGDSWSRSESGLPPGFWFGDGAFATDTASSTIFMGLGDGIFRSNDDGSTWTMISKMQVSSLQVAGGDIYALAGNRIVVLRKDRGFDTLAIPSDDEVLSMAVDARGAVLAMSIDSYGSEVYRTTDLGATWDEFGNGLSGDVTRLLPDPRGGFFAIGQYFYHLPKDDHIWSKLSHLGDSRVSQLVVDGDSTIYSASAMGVLCSLDSGKTWRRRNEGILGATIYELWAVPGDHFVARTDVGIFASDDDGRSWNLFGDSLTANDYWPEIALGSDGTIYMSVWTNAYQTESQIVLSTDGGRLWQRNPKRVPRIGPLLAVGDTLYAWWDDGRLHRSVDRGNVWAQIPPIPGAYFYSVPILALDSTGALLVGGDRELYRSTDAGETWRNSHFPDGVERVYVAPDGTIYLAVKGKLVRSFDAMTYEQIPTVTPFPGEAGIAVDRPGSIYITGLPIYHTADGGLTWSDASGNMEGPVNGPIVGALALGIGGRIYAGVGNAGLYVTDGVSAVDEPRLVLRESDDVGVTVEPTPAMGQTTVRFSLGVSSRVTVTIYDHLGRSVAVLLDEVCGPGRNSVRWDAGSLAVGVYFVAVATPGGITCRRVVVTG